MVAGHHHRAATWTPIVWTIGVGMAVFVFSVGAFYASQMSLRSDFDRSTKQWNDGIAELTKVIKAEGIKREALEKAEAEKREGLRKEYLTLMREQTTTFATLGDKVATVGTEVKVIGTKYEAVDRRLNEIGGTIQRVLEQTAPRRPLPGG